MDHQNKSELFNKMNNPVFKRNDELGKDARKILNAAIQAVDPYRCVLNTIRVDNNQLIIEDQQISLDEFARIFTIGFGKSAVLMAKGLIDIFGPRLDSAFVITKDKKFLAANGYHNKLIVKLGGHPVPSEDSIDGTKALLNSLPPLKCNDLVLILISGGGSALFTQPVDGVTLEDFQILTQSLLKCGADINEINTLRKHLDHVKGGRLAIKLKPAMVKTLILSDVIGDPLDMIASGPTVPDPTTFCDALAIIEKYQIKKQVPSSIFKYLNKGRQGQIPETPKFGDISPKRVQNFLIGTNFIALDAGRNYAEGLGYHTLILSSHLTGKTENVAEFLDGIIKTEMVNEKPVENPWCLLFGGETTVTITGQGLGGRNQDLALKMVEKIKGTKEVLFVSFATDGDDGPTDAAGAVCDGLVFSDSEKIDGLNLYQHIADNDSYNFHKEVGGLIKTGSTGTNVNDLILIISK